MDGDHLNSKSNQGGGENSLIGLGGCFQKEIQL